MPEMKTLTMNGTQYEVVDATALHNKSWASNYSTVLEAAMAMPAAGGTFFAIGDSAIINAADSAFPGGEVTYLMLTDESTSAARRTVIAFHYGSSEGPKYRSIWDRGWRMADWEYLSTAEGYGIGGYAKKITGQDLNTIIEGGRYYWDTATNSPYNNAWCYMDVIPSNGHSVVQKVWLMLDYTGCSVQRVKTDWADTAWTEWEWENPPMVLGTEYRTTERWQGKVVYTACFDLGALPNTTSKQVTLNFRPTHMIAMDASYTKDTFSYVGSLSGVTIYLARYGTGATVTANISANGDNSVFTAVVTVKYTKD